MGKNKFNDKHNDKHNGKHNAITGQMGGDGDGDGDGLGDMDKPSYNPSPESSILNSITYNVKYISLLSLYYLKKYPTEIGFVLGLLAYITIVVILYTRNPYDIITDNNAGLTIFISLLGGFLILMALFFYRRKKNAGENVTTSNTLSYLGKFITLFGSSVILVAIMIALFNIFNYFPDATTFIMFIINALIITGLLTVVVKYFGLSQGEPTDHKPSVIGLLKKIITYIPCLILQLIDYIKYQYQITTKPIVILLLIEVVLISLYFLSPWIAKHILTHNSTQLVKDPKHLNVETKLGTFREVNYVNDKFQYHYAISSWIYIDSLPPETNSKYDEYTSLINIGNKPNILFNVSKNTLRIKMETQSKTEKIIYETDKFHMQRWNNIIVNYDGSTLDIFINNQLVSSTPGVIPYNHNTVMTSGTTNGLHGGVCNVNYYKDSMSRSQINWAYNSVNRFNPPVI